MINTTTSPVTTPAPTKSAPRWMRDPDIDGSWYNDLLTYICAADVMEILLDEYAEIYADEELWESVLEALRTKRITRALLDDCEHQIMEHLIELEEIAWGENIAEEQLREDHR